MTRMELCYGCRHAFPVSSLAPCVFSEIILHRFDEAHKLVREMNPETPEDKHRIVKLQTALRELCSAVNQEIGALKQREEALESARQRDRQERGLGAQPPFNATNSNSVVSVNQTTIHSPRFGSTNYSPRATFNGTVPGYKLRKMNSALELVSAGIYCVLESTAIRTRASVALLWLPPPGVVSTELVAPFVVGRDTSKLRNSAPYRVCENSVPCAVSETGIAVNMKPKSGPNDAILTENIPLVDLIESSNAAQLLVPIFTRYGEVQRSVLGVLHLLGTPVFPCPFTLRNEETAVQTAAMLSIILSSYQETMGGEWANRIYDSSLLNSTAAYQGSLDMRGMEKGLDDFSPPPTFIFRCSNDRKEDDDAREFVKALRHSMGKRAVPKKAVSSVNDLYRFAIRMEQNWVSALKSKTEMEANMVALEKKALLLGAERGRQGRCSVSDHVLHNMSDTHGVQPEGLSSTMLAAQPSVVDKKMTLRPEQIDEIEISALQRLQGFGVDTSPFVTQSETGNV